MRPPRLRSALPTAAARIRQLANQSERRRAVTEFCADSPTVSHTAPEYVVSWDEQSADEDLGLFSGAFDAEM
jgi:hypothetical protein